MCHDTLIALEYDEYPSFTLRNSLMVQLTFVHFVLLLLFFSYWMGNYVLPQQPSANLKVSGLIPDLQTVRPHVLVIVCDRKSMTDSVEPYL